MDPQSFRRFQAAQILAYLTGLLITLPVEVGRLAGEAVRSAGLAAWLLGMNIDTTPYFLLLLVAPLFWFTVWKGQGGTASAKPSATAQETQSPEAANANERSQPLLESRGLSRPSGQPRWRPWLLAAVVGGTSLAVSVGIASMRVDGGEGAEFGSLPPAYHDEYSYLFQAKTFLAGRLWFPSHPRTPRLFDQMHVLNEGRFASRYFPAVGAWMAPFVAFGHPYWGHWLAGALAAMLVFATGRELGGDGVGFLAGELTAVSPGVGLFSNLLLSHHPTLLGVMLFVFTFLRMKRIGSTGFALLAGCGLGFAMLARPMTAAGIGLPFGVWFLGWLIRGDKSSRDQRLRLAVALAVPLLAGFAFLFVYNRALTGSGWTTAYQQYTEIYTPRHVYGFNNVERGEENLGPKVLENYDRWAKNLTPRRAARNVGQRLMASLQWTLGIVPLAMAAVFALLFLCRKTNDWWFIPGAIVSLHAVHVPYWYVGIMHWHYVFESAPFWLLILAGTTQALWQGWQAMDCPAMSVWWVAVLVAALLTAYVPCRPFWSTSRLRTAVENVAFSRQRYAAFKKLIARDVTERPALVLVEPDPADRHIDYVTNDPALDGEVLYGRYRPEEMDIDAILREFPERACYLFRAERGTLQRIRRREGRDP